MTTDAPNRDELAALYIEQLPYEPYRVQEEALLAWFTSERGVLVCAPTGTGKTLIAEAALFEALHSGSVAYYTTPLIALTDQKFYEMRDCAVRWGFREEDVGLVTGNRRINPDARILVVVAEILFNRLLHPAAFDFSQVSAVVMDEFHSFNDPERGIVWELTLGLLPAHVRMLLLSATVGNSLEFINWLSHHHGRRLELVQSDERKVPLTYQWIGDMLLNEFLESMAGGDEQSRQTPALVFCFNRDMCWNVAEQVKGKKLISGQQQKELSGELDHYDWSQGAGPKLRQLLLRGVGVHHAGVLPKYKRIVEELFQRKLLALTICTETLSAGINLPARSVVVPELLKGPPGEKKLIDSSSAHQMPDDPNSTPRDSSLRWHTKMTSKSSAGGPSTTASRKTLPIPSCARRRSRSRRRCLRAAVLSSIGAKLNLSSCGPRLPDGCPVAEHYRGGYSLTGLMPHPRWTRSVNS
jgi:superfamily II RNA helicase